jgi:hypothetical protein
MEIKFMKHTSFFLKSKLPELERGLVYKVRLYAKDEYGKYESVMLHPIFALKKNNIVCFYYYKYDVIPTRYVNEFGNYSIYGDSEKKLKIKRSRKSFYEIHIRCENLTSLINDIDKKIMICSDKVIDWKNEVNKALSKYNFEIKNTDVVQDGNIFEIKVDVEIINKKGFLDYFIGPNKK